MSEVIYFHTNLNIKIVNTLIILCPLVRDHHNAKSKFLEKNEKVEVKAGRGQFFHIVGEIPFSPSPPSHYGNPCCISRIC